MKENARLTWFLVAWLVVFTISMFMVPSGQKEQSELQLALPPPYGYVVEAYQPADGEDTNTWMKVLLFSAENEMYSMSTWLIDPRKPTMLNFRTFKAGMWNEDNTQIFIIPTYDPGCTNATASVLVYTNQTSIVRGQRYAWSTNASDRTLLLVQFQCARRPYVDVWLESH